MERYIERAYQGTNEISLESNAFENFEIYFFEDVNMQSLKSLQMKLLKLNRLDPNREITLYIDSYGGEVNSGLAIYDLIQALSNPLHTVCVGVAGSMAAVLFACGDRRDIFEHSEVMIHDPLIVQMSGSALVVQQMSNNLLDIREQIAEILSKHTKKSKEEILSNTSYDHYFSASEAVEFGLADNVIKEI